MDPFTSYWTNGAYGYLPDRMNPPPNDAGDSHLFAPYSMIVDHQSPPPMPASSQDRHWKPSLVSTGRVDDYSCLNKPHWFYFCPTIYNRFVLDDTIATVDTVPRTCDQERFCLHSNEERPTLNADDVLPTMFIPHESLHHPLPNGGCPLYRYATGGDGRTRKDLVSQAQLLHCQLDPRYNPAYDLTPEQYVFM